MSAPQYASKPDAARAGIVAAVRKLGASWVDLQGRKGTPDGICGFRGRTWVVEIKSPGKENGPCGCTASNRTICATYKYECHCKGHDGTGNSERSTWHAQLAFRENWQGSPVEVWTTPEEAIAALAGRSLGGT